MAQPEFDYIAVLSLKLLLGTHKVCYQYIINSSAAARLGAVLSIVLFTLGGTSTAGLGAEAAHLAVERAFVRHQGHAGLAGRGAVEADFSAACHLRHSDTLGAAILALLEALQASLDAGLHFGHCHRVGHRFLPDGMLEKSRRIYFFY
jgi:hypothetical protein